MTVRPSARSCAVEDSNQTKDEGGQGGRHVVGDVTCGGGLGSDRGGEGLPCLR